MLSTTAMPPRLYALLLALALSLIALAGCEEDTAPVSEVDRERIIEELQERSFRQFQPHVDGDPRKGVILDFFDGVTLWAQYAEGGYAVNEWQIHAASYSVEGSGSKYTIRFNEPGSSQELPTKCTDCVPTEGVSISIRDLFDEDRIYFKLNDLDNVLPSPFPVFGSWTRFSEDEYFNGG